MIFIVAFICGITHTNINTDTQGSTLNTTGAYINGSLLGEGTHRVDMVKQDGCSHHHTQTEQSSLVVLKP